MEEYNINDNKNGDKNILNKNTNPAKAGFDNGDLYKKSIENSECNNWRCVLIKIRTWFEENSTEFDPAPFESFFDKDF